jgi:lactoylglutathione lyase
LPSKDYDPVRIEHVALWTTDLAALAVFWAEHFGGRLSAEYVSHNREGFRSIFVTLPEGARIELMTGPWVGPAHPHETQDGWAHVAISLGSEAAVDAQATIFARLGLLESGPRWTGDGYYEAAIRAPGGILVEIMP